MADVDNDRDAEKIVAVLEKSTNQIGRELSSEAATTEPILVQLRNAQGRLIYAGGGPAAVALHGRAGQQLLREYEGQTYLTAQAGDVRWTLLLAAAWQPSDQLLLKIVKNLWPDLALGFAATLLPILLAVRYGLKPLRQLSDHLRARKEGDLSLIDVNASYTELQQVTASFNQLLLRLREQVQRERAFVQDAAHELRTPLAVIAAQAHVLARASDASERMQARQDLQLAIERSSHLAQQLLTLAALDEAQRKAPQRLDLAELMRGILAALNRTACERCLDLSLESPDQLMWEVDLHLFRSIVDNLLDNALRYAQPGGHVVVSLSALRGSNVSALQLSVADDGPGIVESERERIFERFVRGSDQQVSGTGLGLAIVQSAVRGLRGSVRIADGLQGSGVTFIVLLPSLC
jgi:signal transduction histidine kinase